MYLFLPSYPILLPIPHTFLYDTWYPWYETSYNRRQLKRRHYMDNDTIH